MVGNITQHFEKEERINYNYQNADHSQKLTEWEKRLILRKVKTNPQLSAPKLTKEIANECCKHVNPEMVR